MNDWVLDTDHVSLFLAGNQSIIEQSARRHLDISITIVTVQELYNGWVSRLNRNSAPDDLVKLYDKLAKTLDFIKSVQVLGFDEFAKEQYIVLRQEHKSLTRKRVEKDVRIAAIAPSQNATMVTRNRKDFELIPNLRIENWADVEN